MKRPICSLALGLCLAGCQGMATSDTTASSTQVDSAPAKTPSISATQAADDEQASTRGMRQEFAAWVEDYRRHAAAEGIDAVTLSAAFDDVRFQPRIVELDRSQPEFSQPVWAYLDTAVSDQRVRQGRAKLDDHRDAAMRAEDRYAVPADILTAIWGVESNYGSHFGSFSTIDALATLGFEGRRQDFARRELLAALKILQSGDIDREHMRGSWAGAMGHTQFLPSSFLSYAVDADGDGRRDIWGSVDDVMASTAYYLEDAGWQGGEPWGVEVTLPENFDYAQSELSVRHSSDEWRSQGVRARGDEWPSFDDASVITPAGARGPAFMVGANFRVIMRYNASTSYALAVATLAERIAGGDGIQGDWPRDLEPLSRTQVKEMQRRLNAQGFSTGGAPDGIVGPNTRRGLRAFQHSQDMTPDGFPTHALLERLRDAGES
ncbi:lytic murein transglycosylase [Chromohalobacter nigrandesensis]|uniref:lytic murein transglycosylase n=1 Tax=Chromohalobacter nigrandesensis TaxID=119863 RepID=UPI001FF3751B|nr:lytic murein transglycosylase [Chromohalobacter nigrandesensis]MCK0744426.1 lytic murein transglycosylase [Chromohalobacter nigrandesensis]